jgi:hypothetical protein
MKAFMAVTAFALLALAGVMVAAPGGANQVQTAAMASTGLDIDSLTRNARALPEESYPAH